MKIDELKRCPFCGGEAMVVDIQVNIIKKYEVCCHDCFASMDHYYKTEQEAIEARNIRYTPQTAE